MISCENVCIILKFRSIVLGKMKSKFRSIVLGEMEWMSIIYPQRLSSVNSAMEFVCLYFGTCHDQADACHSGASLYPGFSSIGTRMSVIASSLTSTQV